MFVGPVLYQRRMSVSALWLASVSRLTYLQIFHGGFEPYALLPVLPDRDSNTGSNPVGRDFRDGRSMTATLSDPEIQPDIQHRRGMSERTHRDHVDTRGGDFPDCREVDSS